MTNDAQKTMGVVAVVLFTNGYLGPAFYVPSWVVLAAHAALAAAVAVVILRLLLD